MKQEEEKISRLFQQLKEEDERQMPSFAHAWNTALTRQGKRKNLWSVWRVAVGSALLIVLGVAGASWWMYVRQPLKHQVAFVDTPHLSLENKAVDRADPAPRISTAPVPIKQPRNIARLQRQPASHQPTPILLSQWRSPTQSLLQIPGGQLFTRLPRLDESSVNIKVSTPEPVN
jgi:hypothetical protein